MMSKAKPELLCAMRGTLSWRTTLVLAAMLAGSPLWAQQTDAPQQKTPASNPPAQPDGGSPVANGAANAAASAGQTPDRASAYYHFSLAHMYEDMATNYGRPEYAARAIEEYKLALDADPTSKYLTSGLAELYLRTGRVRDAVMTAQATLRSDPNNLEAHKLLGRVYLQSLGNMQSTGPSEKVLQLAIGEYTKIVELEPNNIENRLVLGQLYTLGHDTARAAEQFRAAQKIDPSSENVVLNLARLYSDSGNMQQAISVLNSVPEEDRSAGIEFALGVSYDQLKESKKAIEAYSKALDLEPDNLDAERGLAEALYDDNQLDPALQHFQSIASADPQDAQIFLADRGNPAAAGPLQRCLSNVENSEIPVFRSRSEPRDQLQRGAGKRFARPL